MIKEIVKDSMFLSMKSVEADVKEDQQVIQDLKDTLLAYRDRCVGLAANMIGVRKRIIAINDGKLFVMLNPEIIKCSGRYYEAEEGCLCHEGEKKTMRYEKIKVSFIDEKGVKKLQTFNGFTAQIIQHEIDHCEGILI